jgi:hypothetical protein
MLDQWLLQYYETGDADYLDRIVNKMVRYVIPLLNQCVHDPEIRLRIWNRTIRKVRLSRRHPELRFDLSRGNTAGFVIAIALHYASRWLVWHEHPDSISD